MSLSAELRAQVKKACDNKCCKCNKEFKTKKVDGDFLEAHHMLPKSRGGKDILGNLQSLCRSCHVLWHQQEGIHAKKDDWDYLIEYLGWLGWEKDHLLTWDIAAAVLERCGK